MKYGKRTGIMLLTVLLIGGMYLGVTSIVLPGMDSSLALFTLRNVDAAAAKYIGTLEFTSPENGAEFVTSSTETVYTVGISVEAGNSDDVARVDYYLDQGSMAKTSVGSSTTGPNFTSGANLAIPLDTNYFTLRAVASADEKYETVSATSQFTVTKLQLASNPDSSPPVIPALAVLNGSTWQEIYPPLSQNPTRPAEGIVQTVATALGATGEGDTVLTLADPYDADRAVQVTVPDGLLEAGEQAIVLVSVADTLERLLGGTTPAALASIPAELVDGGYYIQVSILITTDGGATWTEIPADRLADTPISISFEGIALTKCFQEMPRLYEFATELVQSTSGDIGTLSFTPDTAGAWAAAGGTEELADTILSGDLSEVNGIIAPFKVTEFALCGSSSKAAFACMGLILIGADWRYRRRRANRK